MNFLRLKKNKVLLNSDILYAHASFLSERYLLL